MNLERLDPQLLRHTVVDRTTRILSRDGYDYDALTTQEKIVPVSTVEECTGISFTCPKCHSHTITRWSHKRGTPFYASPVRYRWEITGTRIGDLTVVPDFENEMSIEKDTYTCGWNGSILNGEVL